MGVGEDSLTVLSSASLELTVIPLSHLMGFMSLCFFKINENLKFPWQRSNSRKSTSSFLVV